MVHPISDWPVRRRFLLFDLDGTIVDSAAAIAAAWASWGSDVGISPPKLKAALGGSSRDTIRALVGESSVEPQLRRLRRYELATAGSVRATRGASAFLRTLPPSCYGIVTSSTRDVAVARAVAADVPIPPLLCTADDYVNGKPSAEPYVVGLRQFARTAAECLTFEDSLPGIQSARAAGVEVVAVETYEQPLDRSSRWISDFGELVATVRGDFIEVEKPGLS